MKQSDQKIYLNEGNQEMLRWMPSNASTKLDVGCGGGVLARILKEKGHTIDGITLSQAEVNAAQSYTRNVLIHNLENGLPPTLMNVQYDVVVCSHVLEHIVYPKQLLMDINKVLKPGGRLLIALPNIMHYKSRFKLMRGDFEYQEAGIWDYTHVKWYTFKSSQRLVQDFGFKVDEAYVTGKLPFYSLFKKLFPEKLNNKLYQVLTKFSKGFFGYQIVICASK